MDNASAFLQLFPERPDIAAEALTKFWPQVDRSGGPELCWIWTGNKNTSGYGCVRLGGRQHQAHRIAYMLAYGSFPPELFVMHLCDTRPCVNPAHLVLGTHAANMADRQRKGRQARGERNGNAKLTEAQVNEVRTRLAAGDKPGHIAPDYGVTETTIRDISHGLTWRHIA